jgi:hypothetical protein
MSAIIVGQRKDTKKHTPPKPGLHPHPVIPPQPDRVGEHEPVPTPPRREHSPPTPPPPAKKESR